MGIRQIDLANRYADLKRLRRAIYLLEQNAAQTSGAKSESLTNKRLLKASRAERCPNAAPVSSATSRMVDKAETAEAARLSKSNLDWSPTRETAQGSGDELTRGALQARPG